MAKFECIKPVTFPVGGAIAQYVFVTVDSSGNVVAAAADADAIGITLEAVTVAEYNSGAGKVVVPVALIQAGGKCPVRVAASTAIAVGGKVAAGANGEAVAANSSGAELGVALEASGSDADQEVIKILLDKSARQTP